MSDIPRTAVNQAPGGGTDYPFSEPTALNGAVLDFYISYEGNECQYELPFTLAVIGVNFEVSDANSVLVASAPTTGGTSRTWGDRTVYEWTNDPWVMRAVVRDDLLEDGSGVLDTRTCDRLPARVKSIRVGLVKMTGNIKFETGFNIALSGNLPDTPTDGGRFTSVVNIDAVPGAGTGRVNGCDEVSPVVRKINQIVPDCGGNFVIEADDCFRAQLPLLVTGGINQVRGAEYAEEGLTSEQARAAIKLTSDCHPCCSCADFVDTYRGLKRIWDKWKTAAMRAEAVRDTYEENRLRWLESRQCRLEHPARLVMTTDTRCKTFVGGSFCNFTSCCISPVELRFTFQRFKSGVLVPWAGGTPADPYINGTTTEGDEKYAPITVGPIVRFFLPYANPQDMSVAKMKFCTTACASDESLQSTLTVHVRQPDPNPHTGDTCVTPIASVPTDITDIWTAYDVPATPDVRAILTKTVALNPNKPTFDCGC